MTNNQIKKAELFLNKVDELKNISGFLNVYKRKANNVKGFKWIYSYKEDGEDKYISNIHLFVLKYIVSSKKLPWKIINQSQAKKSVDLEKSNFHLFDKGSGILFVDMIKNKYNPFNGFWQYKFNKAEFYDISLTNLKKIVEANGFPWIILNDPNASESYNKDLSLNFNSGIYMVKKIFHEQHLGLFRWCYIYKSDLNNYELLFCDDLNQLRDEILKKGLEWKIIDKSKFNKSVHENEINLRNIKNRKWTYTGFQNVRKRKRDDSPQGFVWVFRFKKNGQFVQLSSTDLIELKEKVIKNGFDWIVEDENLAEKSVLKNNENLERYGFLNNKNKTGIFRVYKNRNDKSKQGFYWCYGFSVDKKRKRIQSVNLLELKKKVLDNGLEWKIIDRELMDRSFKENKLNMRKYYH